MNMTDAELDQYLLANYPQKLLTRMMKECRVSLERIRQRIKALSIEDKAAEREFRLKNMRNMRRQKNAEYIDAIERLAPTHSWTEIAQMIGITKSRVAKFAAFYGFHHTKETEEVIRQRKIQTFINAPWTEERRQRISESVNATRRQEKLRIRWGLPQKTKLKIEKMPTRIKSIRRYLVSYGYFTSRDDLYTIYYDEQTNRCPALHVKKGRQTEEYFAMAYGLVFKAADGYEDEIREAVV